MNIPFISRPKLETLLNREITLFDINFWSKTGAVYTPNNFDYQFIYRADQNCIGSISLEEGELGYVFQNIFHLSQNFTTDPVSQRSVKLSKGVLIYHGGISKFSSSPEIDPEFTKRSTYLATLG